MNTKIVRFTSRIIVCLVITAILCGAGYVAIHKQTDVEAAQSSYKMTEFDYVIVSPSKEQVESFAANQEAVNAIMPCYNMDVTVYGLHSAQTNLLLTEYISSYDVGLFNQSLLLSGEYDEDGIMLDEALANKLGVVVGDSVQFSLGGSAFSLRVAAIYRTSTYKAFDEGVALAGFTDEMKACYSRELAYNLAFVDAKDPALCDAMLAEYKPLGQMLSENVYVENFKKQNNLPPNTSEEEWNASILTAYEEYKTKFMNADYEGVVQKKLTYLEDIQERVETKQNEVGSIVKAVIIAATGLYAIASVIFSLRERGDNQISLADGVEKKTLFTIKVVEEILSVAVISVATYLFLNHTAIQGGFADASRAIVMCCAGAIWLALPVTLPVARFSLSASEKALK